MMKKWRLKLVDMMVISLEKSVGVNVDGIIGRMTWRRDSGIQTVCDVPARFFSL